MAEPTVQDAWRTELELPALPLGELPRRAARRWPDRAALISGDRVVTFAGLEERVRALAAAVAGAVPAGGVVGVVTVLDPVFAGAYYGAARAGRPVVTLNPFLRGEALLRILTRSHARLAFLTGEAAERLAPHRAQLPELTVVVTDAEVGDAPKETVALPDFLAAAPDACAEDGDAAAPSLEATACLHFTSGTTGAPKAVRLSHRALTANAAQTGHAQGLDESSVTLNQLPLFHIMHLNSALWAGATQVLCTDGDPAAAVQAADAHGATHWFSIPMRLARMAADPGLTALRPRTLRGIFCGGSALRADVAEKLGAHFGFPVVQGYGLAEASPTVTLDLPHRPRPGSCGPAVAGTGVRVVDVDGRQVLGAGQKGEIQIRGPQLMTGYAGSETGEDVGTDGWFSTGDVGHLDEDGYLFLSDRLGDVFKCDHELVAPADVEEVLLAHEAVADCVVFGMPDGLSGAVPHGLVVLRDGAEAGQVMAAVNRELAPFERLRRLEAVTEVPRSPGGKVQRHLLRDRAAAAPDNRPR